MNISKEDTTLERLVSVKEAAVILGTSARSIYRSIKAGKLQAFRVGTAFYLDKEALEDVQRGARVPDPSQESGVD
jgi:excisionase family DNA binding protein